jgi:hypothetical protein
LSNASASYAATHAPIGIAAEQPFIQARSRSNSNCRKRVLQSMSRCECGTPLGQAAINPTAREWKPACRPAAHAD